jgi:hypothetical protein
MMSNKSTEQYRKTAYEGHISRFQASNPGGSSSSTSLRAQKSGVESRRTYKPETFTPIKNIDLESAYSKGKHHEKELKDDIYERKKSTSNVSPNSSKLANFSIISNNSHTKYDLDYSSGKTVNPTSDFGCDIKFP